MGTRVGDIGGQHDPGKGVRGVGLLLESGADSLCPHIGTALRRILLREILLREREGSRRGGDLGGRGSRNLLDLVGKIH